MQLLMRSTAEYVRCLIDRESNFEPTAIAVLAESENINPSEAVLQRLV